MKEKPNLYIVSFGYDGPYANFPDCAENACKALDNAEQIIFEICERKFLDHVHAYSWTDGSLYKYFRSDLKQDKFAQKLRHAFDDNKTVRVLSVDALLELELQNEAMIRFEAKDRRATETSRKNNNEQ